MLAAASLGEDAALLDLLVEAAQGALERLVLTHSDFSQSVFTSSDLGLVCTHPVRGRPTGVRTRRPRAVRAAGVYPRGRGRSNSRDWLSRVLDPRICEANIQGGVVWGLSALRTAITFDNGRALETNFHKFAPLHLWETPRIEAYFIDSAAAPTGAGEIGPVPTLAACCNAVFAATGTRIRELPLSTVRLTLA